MCACVVCVCSVNPRPFLLLGHFSAVALYAIYYTFRSQGIFALHRSLYKSVGIFAKACGVILPLVWSEVKTVIKY